MKKMMLVMAALGIGVMTSCGPDAVVDPEPMPTTLDSTLYGRVDLGQVVMPVSGAPVYTDAQAVNMPLNLRVAPQINILGDLAGSSDVAQPLSLPSTLKAQAITVDGAVISTTTVKPDLSYVLPMGLPTAAQMQTGGLPSTLELDGVGCTVVASTNDAAVVNARTVVGAFDVVVNGASVSVTLDDPAKMDSSGRVTRMVLRTPVYVDRAAHDIYKLTCNGSTSDGLSLDADLNLKAGWNIIENTYVMRQSAGAGFDVTMRVNNTIPRDLIRLN